MILRDVIYSDQRRLLSGKVEIEPSMTKIAAVPVFNVADKLAEPPTVSAEPLTTQQVVKWLEEQSETVRGEVAVQLSVELKALYAEAFKQGQVAGTVTAEREINAKFESVFDAFRSMAGSAEQAFSRQQEELMSACVTIVGEALAKLIGPALVQPEASLTAVKLAIRRISGARQVMIRVNSNEMAVIESKRTEIAECLGSQDFSIVEDSRVTSGGCLIDSSFGELDARWEIQLLGLIDTLRNTDASSSVDK